MVNRDQFEYLQDEVISDARFPEPVRVLRVDTLGASRFTLRAVGTDSQKYYERVLARSDIDTLIPQIHEQGVLTGDPARFKLATEAHRIRLAHLYDPLFAVSVSKIDPLPHQLEAVYEYMLPQPALRFMLADDPGAGKTIMAGLLLKELKLRGVLDRVLIVVPSPLRTQWQRELQEKFDEHFDIVERATLNALGTERTWNLVHQAVVSIDFIKQPDILDGIAVADMWDLIIVDEAHKMSAYRRGPTKIDRSQRHHLGEILSERAERFLLMTATPHKGDTENFRLLLALIDSDLFANEQILQRAVARQENPIFLRRLKEDMRQFNGEPLFPPRNAITVRYELEGEEYELYDRVTSYVENYFNRAMSADNRNVTFALIVLQRRLASSVRAVRRSLGNRHQRLTDLRADVLRDPEELRRLRKKRLEIADDDDMTEEQRWELEQEALRFTVADNIDELDNEIEQLEELIELAEQVENSQPERKLEELRGVIDGLDVEHPGEKLLIFTEAKDTLDYLIEKLDEWRVSTVTIHGGMKPEDRVAAEDTFRSDKVRVMVATEAAGEGINLQFCHLMVNYDIPWNPTRLEQRLGRIHRYGQDREVFMYNLVAINTREGRVLEAVFSKLEQMRKEMGSDRVYDIVGERFTDARLEKMIQEHVVNRRMFDDILATLDSAMPENNSSALEAASLSSLATRHINIAAMAELRQRAKENRLAPAYIRAFFRDALEAHFPGRIDQRSDGYWRIRYVPPALRDLPAELARRYRKPEERYLRFTFDIDEARKTGIEAIGPGHPLFESLLQHTITKCRDQLEQGAMFLDPDNRREGLVWLVEGTVNDGLDAVVGQKLFAVYQPVSSDEMEALPPSMFIDFGLPKQSLSPPETLKQLLNQRDQILGWSIEQQIEPYEQEIKERRQHEVGIVRRYLKESFEVQIAESDSKLMGYEEQQERGRDMQMPINEEERRNEDLRRRMDGRLQRADREAMISMSTPRILGVAGILPADRADQGAATGTVMRRDDEVELAAIDYVMQYEREQGREPKDRSPDKLPFDISSKAEDGETRYIEVKGRAGVGAVELTGNEWLTAQNMGEDYWLYIVSNATSDPQLTIIRDPAHTLPSDDVVKRTRYHVPAETWQSLSATD